MITPAYFERLDAHRYRPTVHAGGAWSDDEVHFSPLGGLIVHAIERHLADRPGADLLISRVSFDILGMLATEECEIRVETMRAGRTIELLEATAHIGGRAAVRARIWRLTAIDTESVAGVDTDPLPNPETIDPWPMTALWSGGYIASLDVRAVQPPRPGRASAWVATPLALVAGETASALASFVALIDTANGLAPRRSPREWLFPNVDLTVHLHRQPAGRWVGLDTGVTFGPTGQGITSSVLHDLTGPVGHAQQILTVRPQPPR